MAAVAAAAAAANNISRGGAPEGVVPPPAPVPPRSAPGVGVSPAQAALLAAAVARPDESKKEGVYLLLVFNLVFMW